jgi:hypothetical protein
MHLRSVLVDQFTDGFDLDEYLVEANEIGFVELFEQSPLVLEFQPPLGEKGEPTERHFHFKAFLVNRFRESIAHFVVDLDARADDCVRLFFVNDFHRRFSREKIDWSNRGIPVSFRLK